VCGLDGGDLIAARDRMTQLARSIVTPAPDVEVRSYERDGKILLVPTVGRGTDPPYGITLPGRKDKPVEFYVRRDATTFPAAQNPLDRLEPRRLRRGAADRGPAPRRGAHPAAERPHPAGRHDAHPRRRPPRASDPRPPGPGQPARARPAAARRPGRLRKRPAPAHQVLSIWGPGPRVPRSWTLSRVSCRCHHSFWRPGGYLCFYLTDAPPELLGLHPGLCG
jgi:hypothetical protein